MSSVVIHDQGTLEIFRENGHLIAQIRAKLVAMAHNLASREQIDQEAERLIFEAGGEPAFQKVAGYHWTTCICINDCLVHGIPKGKLVSGDLVTIDVGMFYKGTTTDIATTVLIGDTDPDKEHFLNVGRKTMRKAIAQVKAGNKVKHISKQLQRIPEKAGYAVTRDLVGHGLGKTMHEPPEIPCFVASTPAMKVVLQAGMVITVEAMYMEGDWPLKTDDDGWTMRTADGSLAAMFEEDIIVTQEGPEVISVVS